jgi:hypothetical protein
VNGNAAQAYVAVMPSRVSAIRRPSRKIPAIVSRSNVSAAPWAAGRSSHDPLHGSACSNGTYAAYATGPYVSPCALSSGQPPYSGSPSASLSAPITPE